MIATEFGNVDVFAGRNGNEDTRQKVRGEIVFLTHPCREQSFHAALAALKLSGTVEVVCNWFRVETS